MTFNIQPKGRNPSYYSSFSFNAPFNAPIMNEISQGFDRDISMEKMQNKGKIE